MKQVYNNYTKEDFEVWRTLFERQMKVLRQVASEEYLQGVQDISFRANQIPVFDEINDILNRITGWRLHVVPSIIPVNEFFPLLANKKFSATTWLRRMDQLDYLEEPDMFHDVFGHVPLLTHATFCNFFHGLAMIAMRHVGNQRALDMLGRMYWFTIEFGLIHEGGKTKIYGAGILSSHGETNFCLGPEPQRKPFDVREILTTEFDNMRIQEKYFVIKSYSQLFDSLLEIERVLEEELTA